MPFTSFTEVAELPCLHRAFEQNGSQGQPCHASHAMPLIQARIPIYGHIFAEASDLLIPQELLR